MSMTSSSLCALLIFSAAVIVAQAEIKYPHVPGVLIVRNNNGVSAAAVGAYGLEDEKRVGRAGHRRMRVKDGEGLEAKIQKLKAQGLDAEPDYILSANAVPNDAAWSSIQAAMTRIGAPQAWDIHTGGANAPTVCVIDTGISISHPDLAANINTAVYGYNAITNTAGTAVNDDNGHGTHCSGTIGGVANNGLGVAGVAWNVKLIGCKFLSAAGSGTLSDAIECVQWCRSQGAKITSNSWGGGPFSQALYDEIKLSRDAGHLFVVAAGNDGYNMETTKAYPASYDLDNIISVGAADVDDTKAYFSNYGVTTTDLFAPGTVIYSTWLNNDYQTLAGTSMACPHVSGAAALLWSYNPSLSWQQVKQLLMNNVDKVSALTGTCITGGRLNILKALQAAGGSAPTPAPTPVPVPASPKPSPIPSPVPSPVPSPRPVGCTANKEQCRENPYCAQCVAEFNMLYFRNGIQRTCNGCLCVNEEVMPRCYQCLSWARPGNGDGGYCYKCSSLYDNAALGGPAAAKECFDCTVNMDVICTQAQSCYSPPTRTASGAAYSATTEEVMKCWDCMAKHRWYLWGTMECGEMIAEEEYFSGTLNPLPQ